MKKIINLLLLILVFLLPVMVYGEECDSSCISITNIELSSITGKAKEESSPSIDNNKINLDIKFNDVGDVVEYNLFLRNSSNEDYFINEDTLNNISDYVDYSLEYNNNSNIVKANSDQNIKLKVEYKNEVPPVEEGNLILYDAKTISIDLNTSSKEINVPDTGINNEFLIITIVLIITIGLALYNTNKKMYIIIITILLLPAVTKAVCKVNIEVNSNIKIARPVPVTSTIYWALQDNNSDNINETLVISNREVDGIKKGSFAGDTEFTSESEVPWIIGDYFGTANLSYNVSNIKIEGIVSPKSTANWFNGVGYNATTFNADLSNLITKNITNMSSMFSNTGRSATTWNI